MMNIKNDEGFGSSLIENTSFLYICIAHIYLISIVNLQWRDAMLKSVAVLLLDNAVL